MHLNKQSYQDICRIQFAGYQKRDIKLAGYRIRRILKAGYQIRRKSNWPDIKLADYQIGRISKAGYQKARYQTSGYQIGRIFDPDQIFPAL